MKTCLIIALTACFAARLVAQPDQPLQPTAKTQLAPQLSAAFAAAHSPQPNEMKIGRVTCSGVIPQAIKSKQPWQLINPAAPPEYWPTHENTDRDVITGKINGFKFLSFSF